MAQDHVHSAYARFLAAAYRFGGPELREHVLLELCSSPPTFVAKWRKPRRLHAMPVDVRLPLSGRILRPHWWMPGRRIPLGGGIDWLGNGRLEMHGGGLREVSTVDVATWLDVEALLLERSGGSPSRRLRIARGGLTLFERSRRSRHDSDWPIGSVVQARSGTGTWTLGLRVGPGRWVHHDVQGTEPWNGVFEDAVESRIVQSFRTSIDFLDFHPDPPPSPVREASVPIWSVRSAADSLARILHVLPGRTVERADPEALAALPSHLVTGELRLLWTRWGATNLDLGDDASLLGPRFAHQLLRKGNVREGLLPVLSRRGRTTCIDVLGTVGPPGCLTDHVGRSVHGASLEDWLESRARSCGAIDSPAPVPPLVPFAVPSGPRTAVLTEALEQWPVSDGLAGDSVVRRTARTLLEPRWRPWLHQAVQPYAGGAVDVLGDRLQEAGLAVPKPILKGIVRAVG